MEPADLSIVSLPLKSLRAFGQLSRSFWRWFMFEDKNATSLIRPKRVARG